MQLFLLAVLLALVSSIDVESENTAKVERSLIVGGFDVPTWSWPYFVHFGNCGGVLIAPDVVLTAAHCRYQETQQVIIGAKRAYSLYGEAQECFCEWSIPHPDYGNRDRDWALCKLNEPVSIDKSRVRLELNNDNAVPTIGDNLSAAGFGNLYQGELRASWQKRPLVLQEVGGLEYISNEDCYLNSNLLPNTENMLCAVSPTFGRGTCSGDSGGPIVKFSQGPDGVLVHTIVGTTSWGGNTCGEETPTVYSRTSMAYEWIIDTTCNTFKSIADFCDNPNDPPPPEACEGSEVSFTVHTPPTSAFYDDISISKSLINRYELVASVFDEVEGQLFYKRNYTVADYSNTHTVCLEQNRTYSWSVNNFWNPSSPMCEDGGSCGWFTVSLDGEVIYEKSSAEVENGAPFVTTFRTPLLECEDDINFQKGSKNKDCRKYLKRGNLTKKCNNNHNGQKVFDFCRKTCGEAGIGECAVEQCEAEDDEEFLFKDMNCEDYLSGNAKTKCGKMKNGKMVYDWCPKTCGFFNLGVCSD